MFFFDPHIHMSSRTTDDYVSMAKAGILAVCEPAFWGGQPRTHVGTYEDYLTSIIGWEKFRASQFGIHHFCTLSLNPREANNLGIADGVLELLPRYLDKDGVVGIGEIGFDEINPTEEKYFVRQLEMAREHEMPVLIHTPHRDKKRGTERIIALVKEVKLAEEMVLIDHNTEETLPIVLGQSHCWAGHSIYPNTKMTPERMVRLVQQYGAQRIIINSAADWGVSDPLSVPKTAELMRQAFPEDVVETLFWKNPIAFFKQSGNLDEEEIKQRPSIDQTRLWEGNSVLRGQVPVVEKR